MRSLVFSLLLFGLTSANATVIRTIDGITYEWLEISETPIATSRENTEALLRDTTSSIYGYEFASRELVSKLLLSYASWDGYNGLHQDSDVVAGGQRFFEDFGFLTTQSANNTNVATPDGDGVVEGIAGYHRFAAMYGTTDECALRGIYPRTCYADMLIAFDSSGNYIAWEQGRQSGWDPDTGGTEFFDLELHHSRPDTGSFLVRVTAVPVPAAVWLFGSALAGLGWMRRQPNA